MDALINLNRPSKCIDASFNVVTPNESPKARRCFVSIACSAPTRICAGEGSALELVRPNNTNFSRDAFTLQYNVTQLLTAIVSKLFAEQNMPTKDTKRPDAKNIYKMP